MTSVHRPLKVVVAGPVGAGKTTFVQTISETAVIATDVEASEDIGKLNTTVAFDFGTLRLDGQELHLYGTPGQDRFSFMWEVLCEGALGLVLLVAGDRPQDFLHARNILDFITSRNPIPFLVGVTRQDQGRVWQPSDVALYFDLPERQVVGLNATDPAEGRGLLANLLELTLTPLLAPELGDTNPRSF
ncbi:GTP-binding protein [Deinococcus aquatilis]|uniref:GTP-binding protein n=1 Tax=Deinococcus aquatilis TaxID=519440 RepID=UPI00047731B7|nr:ATP/GTP-binding protein [Deinococcus aquatilis]